MLSQSVSKTLEGIIVKHLKTKASLEKEKEKEKKKQPLGIKMRSEK